MKLDSEKNAEIIDRRNRKKSLVKSLGRLSVPTDTSSSSSYANNNIIVQNSPGSSEERDSLGNVLPRRMSPASSISLRSPRLEPPGFSHQSGFLQRSPSLTELAEERDEEIKAGNERIRRMTSPTRGHFPKAGYSRRIEGESPTSSTES